MLSRMQEHAAAKQRQHGPRLPRESYNAASEPLPAGPAVFVQRPKARLQAAILRMKNKPALSFCPYVGAALLRTPDKE